MHSLRLLACGAFLLGSASCFGTPDSASAGEPGITAPADLPAARRTVLVDSLSGLQAALDTAEPGDHIVLTDGSYQTREPIRIDNSGSEGAPIVVRSETVGGAEISGASGFVLDDAAHVVIYGFVFTHGRTQEVPVGSHHVRVARNTFELSDR